MSKVSLINENDQAFMTHEWAILLFESPWCCGCKELLKGMENLSFDQVVDCFLAKVDITQNQSMAKGYGVLSLPTVIIFQKGLIKERITGAMSEAKFIRKIKDCIEYGK